jgi:hypothetical protein
VHGDPDPKDTSAMHLPLITQLTSRLHDAGPEPEHVHFHSGQHGRPYACHDPRCTSPGLDRADLEA